MTPDGLGHQISRNDVTSLTYQLVYGQRYEVFALYKFVGWLSGVPVHKQKQRTVQALMLTHNDVIIAQVDPKRFDLARLLYETVSGSISCGLCGKKATTEVQAETGEVYFFCIEHDPLLSGMPQGYPAMVAMNSADGFPAGYVSMFDREQKR